MTTGLRTKDSIDQALLEKIKRDPFYASAYDILGSLEDLYDAGFFDDGSECAPGSIPGSYPAELFRAGDDWIMTPLHKIKDRLDMLGDVSSEQKLAVLLLTGSFCPVHRGHIEALEIAKEELEARGIAVLGGYLSPSHDSYVSTKCQDEHLSANHRLHLCQAAVADSSWLMADGWEALGVDRAINFSDVIVRLESYLARHIKSSRPIDVHYVFSGDHARFSRAFIARGQCVCVPRPGYEEALQKYASASHVKNNRRIIFAERKLEAFSSFKVRKGELAQMDKNAGRIYAGWLSRSDDAPAKGTYFLRNEGAWATAHWSEDRDQVQLKKAWDLFCRELLMLLKQSHQEAAAPDARQEVDFEILDLIRQKWEWLELRGDWDEKIISIDACIEGDFNLAVARHFPLSAGLSRFEIGRRPYYQSLEKQIQSIPPGHYILVDDDIATGTTMKAVQSLPFPEGVNIIGYRALLERHNSEDKQFIDILDSRDFLAGARKGGLVVNMPDGDLARAPYCLPYVSPANRASVPLSSEIRFSQAVWRLNESFFNSVAPAPLLLKDSDVSFQQLMLYAGFNLLTPLADICNWHAERLSFIGR